MAKGVSINKQAIAKLNKELEREFAKTPVKVPVVADPARGSIAPQSSTVNHYYGPTVTVNGNHSQIAWGDGGISQAQGNISQITEGYEDVADVVAGILSKLDSLPLNANENEDARSSAEELLAEVVKPEPDKGIIRRGATMLKGVLAPVAAGVNQAATSESADYARKAIEAIGAAIGS